MEMTQALNSLVGAVQEMLLGTDLDLRTEEGYDGKVLRLPATFLDSNDGYAVQVNIEEEPGTIIYRLVPYPQEASSADGG